jgi:hypothetical protein
MGLEAERTTLTAHNPFEQHWFSEINNNIIYGNNVTYSEVLATSQSQYTLESSGVIIGNDGSLIPADSGYSSQSAQQKNDKDISSHATDPDWMNLMEDPTPIEEENAMHALWIDGNVDPSLTLVDSPLDFTSQSDPERKTLDDALRWMEGKRKSQ